MARSIRSSQLETRAARLRLKPRRAPYVQVNDRGIRAAYRRLTSGSGTWSGMVADGRGSSWMAKLPDVVADDFEDADGVRVLTFWQACAAIRKVARGEDATAENPNPDRAVTVDMAVTGYADDLAARGGDSRNASWLRSRLPATLRAKVLALVEAREFRRWRDALVAEGALTKSSINRLMKAAKACFTLAASLDKRIANKAAWTEGLKALPEGETARNVVIAEAEVRAVVAEAYKISDELGRFVELGAVTAARPSQLARLTCADALPDRVMMPASRKGRGKRVMKRRAVPIPSGLAARLIAIAKGRPPDAPLLLTPSGEPWRAGNYYLPFQAAVQAAGLDAARVTYYAVCRHTRITSLLLAGTPIRLVADACDTSVAMIEKSYAWAIVDHGDALLRAGMLDLDAAPAAPNVVRITKRPKAARMQTSGRPSRNS
jgi:hypothetical protein